MNIAWTVSTTRGIYKKKEGKWGPNADGKGQQLVSLDAARELLQNLPSTKGGWWSPHSWTKGRASAANWESTGGVAVDIDWKVKGLRKAGLPVEKKSWLETPRSEGDTSIPGNLLYLTPHGFRLVFCFKDPLADRELTIKAIAGAQAVVHEWLAGLEWIYTDQVGSGFEVDSACTDLGRRFFSPKSWVEEESGPRDATVYVIAQGLFTPTTLAERAPPGLVVPPATDQAPATQKRVDPAPIQGCDETKEEFCAAVERFNEVQAKARGPYPPPGSGTCPACKHQGCWGMLKDDPGHWYCFSENHTPTVGRKKDANSPGYFGDWLDIVCHERQVGRAELLCAESDPTSGKPFLAPLPTVAADDCTELDTFRGLLSQVVDLLADDTYRERLTDQPGPLAFNLLTARVEIGGSAVDLDAVRLAIRENAERRFCTVRTTKKRKDYWPIVIGRDLVDDAILRAAQRKSYHPVQNYLNGLTWDGTPRLDSTLARIFKAEPAGVARNFFRWWMIQAAARVFKPGCQADSILVLFSERQGVKKSTFFRQLLPDESWSTAQKVRMDGDKDSLMVLHSKVIVELAELAALKGAEAEDVKAFTTRTEDTFRRPYSRDTHGYPRGFVFGGTTNRSDFLRDSTGNRRFLTVALPGAIGDMSWLVANRDQLWAEAVHRFKADERYYPDDAELRDLEAYCCEFMVAADTDEDVVFDILASLTAEAPVPIRKVVDIWAKTLADPAGTVSIHDKKDLEARLVKVFGKAGWVHTGINAKRVNGGVRRGWYPTERAAGIAAARRGVADATVADLPGGLQQGANYSVPILNEAMTQSVVAEFSTEPIPDKYVI